MRKTILFLILLSASSVLAAGRHRIVGLPVGPPVTITGQVIDAVTREGVARIEIAGANETLRADFEGRFTITVPKGVPAKLTFTRTGYETLEQTININESRTMTFEVQPLPTATLRTTAGVTHVIDADSIEFGYSVPFVGSRSSATVKMCRPGVDEFDLSASGIRRIIGPAVISAQASCCATGPVTGARFVLDDNQEITAYFVDSCEFPHIFVFARDHETWQRMAIELSDVAEVIVP